jgi:DNA-binding NtrC family response regulator
MEGLRVLVVDDEIDFLETIVNRLKRRNLTVTGVDSGQKAVELIEEREFDVVILDVKMPGMDGIEILKRIKYIRPFTEVIMVTGHGSVKSGIKGLQYGAFDYIMKPVKIDDLLEKISQAYERKQLQEKKTFKS